MGKRLGDLGEVIGGAWEGIGKVTGWNEEIKRLDVEVNQQGLTNGGLMTPVSLIAEGTDFNQRDGHSIKAISFEARLFFVAAAATSGVCRAILYADAESAGVIPAATGAGGILEATAAPAQQPLAAYQHDGTERFYILADDLISLDAGGPGVKALTWKVPLNHHIRYSTANGNQAATKEGNLYILLIADNGGGVSEYGGFYSRLSYVDN